MTSFQKIEVINVPRVTGALFFILFHPFYLYLVYKHGNS